MGLFDKKNRGLFNGIFDFNMDGKIDLFEEFLGFEMLEEEDKQENHQDEEGFNDIDDF